MYKVRLRRLINEKTGRIILLPMDHGISNGPIPGLQDIGVAIQKINKSPVNGIILHKGCILRFSHLIGHHQSIIMHLNASSDISLDPNSKVIVSGIRDAVNMGADGVSIHINWGVKGYEKMLHDLGKISSECFYAGMPLIVMVYARGENLEENNIQNILKTIRIAMELGADIIKVPVPENVSDLSEIVRYSSIPVILAGGSKYDSVKHMFDTAYRYINEGGAGFAIGRNCFQFADPPSFINGLNLIVNKGASVNEALSQIKNIETIKI